jgi:type-F conjugative transfer system pilin assembly protein TrbC
LEEEKLLFSVKKFLFISFLIATGISNNNIYANELDKGEFDKLLNNKVNQKLFVSEESVNFYMFASLSLSDNLLKQMFEYAKLYNGTIVLRGIEDNSFIKTSQHIQRIATDGDAAAIIIDPTLFKKFQVIQVPTYVLAKNRECPIGTSCKPSYDKIIGNITPKYALEKFVEKGDLSQEAQDLLGEER